MVELERVRDGQDAHTHTHTHTCTDRVTDRQRCGAALFLWNISAFLLRSACVKIYPGLYNFPEAHAISVVIPLTYMLHAFSNVSKWSKVSDHSRGWPKAPFSIATTARCRGGHYSFPWIAPLYPWTVPYNAEC